MNLTDGTNVQFGCVNTTSGATGCKASQLDTSIRMASFRRGGSPASCLPSCGPPLFIVCAAAHTMKPPVPGIARQPQDKNASVSEDCPDS